MKKFLALVLALVMTMSLVTMGTSAAFTDAESIKYDEAVNTLVSLGVIDGMGDGTYAPEGGVTRAQMAKFVTLISIGLIDPSAFEGIPTDLTDVDGHWAEGYIKYCYDKGIIAGKGNGKFDPDAPVTTAEAAKMLLVALGWNASAQGYVGDTWMLRSMGDATKYKVLQDVTSLKPDKALTRDEAAKLVYNTILADVVEATANVDREDGSVTDTYRVVEGKSLLNRTFEAYRFVGQITNVDYNSAAKTYEYKDSNVGGNDQASFKVVGVIPNDIDADGLVRSFTTADDYTDLFLDEVSVVARYVDGDWKVLGMASTGAVTSKTVAKNSLSVVDTSKLKVDGVVYDVERKTAATGDFDVTDAVSIRGDLAGNAHLKSTSIVKLVDIDKNGDLDFAYEYKFSVAEVTNVVADTRIDTKVGSYKYEDNEIESGIAKGDWVYILKGINGVNVVSKIESFESKLSGMKEQAADGSDTNKTAVKFDGNWFNKNGKDVSVIGATYRIWALNGVVVNSKQISGSNIDNLVMVYNMASSTEYNKVLDYIDASGVKYTGVKVDAGTADDDAQAFSDIVVGRLYIITKTDDGVQFVPAGADDPTNYKWIGGVATQEPAKGGTTVNSLDDTYLINDDAVVFIHDNGTGVKVVSGKEFKNFAIDYVDIEADQGYYVYTAGAKRVTHVAATYNTEVEGGSGFDGFEALTGNEIYAYVTSSSSKGEKVDGKQYVEFSIWNGSEYLEVQFAQTASIKSFSKGDIITYDTIKDGVLGGVKVLTDDSVDAAIHTIEGDWIFYGEGKDECYKKTSDTKVLYINSNAKDASEIGQTSGTLQEATKWTSKTPYMDNIAYVVNSKDEFKVIVVDVNNMMTRNNTGKVVGIEEYTVNDEERAQVGQMIELDFGDDVLAEGAIDGLVNDEGEAPELYKDTMVLYVAEQKDLTGATDDIAVEK